MKKIAGEELMANKNAAEIKFSCISAITLAFSLHLSVYHAPVIRQHNSEFNSV